MLIAPAACPALNSSGVLQNYQNQNNKSSIYKDNIRKKMIKRNKLYQTAFKNQYLTSRYLCPAWWSSCATLTGTEVGIPVASKFHLRDVFGLQKQNVLVQTIPVNYL